MDGQTLFFFKNRKGQECIKATKNIDALIQCVKSQF